ncbi:WW domain-containing adapter protein with coiled-coil wacky isoform X1 [Haemaphysalis longicornis]
MVMHARKLPRLSDGYFDRNQAHPYESKYSSKSNLGSRYSDKVRESPSNGSHSRMGSPDSRHSPRYHKSSYRIKDRDKDHERGYVRYVHDSKYKNSSSGSSKSPAYKDRFSKNSSLGGGGGGGGGGGSGSSSSGAKEPSKPRPVDSTAHRTNHERSQVEPQPQPPATENKDRRQQVGDWSEHVSSSGKKYYYNCKTEISQWEKPKEWVDWEKQQPGAGSGVGNSNSSNSSCSSSGSMQRGLATSTPTDPGSGPRPKSRSQDRPPTTVASPAPTTAPPITTSSSMCSRAAAAASDKHSTGSNSTVSSSSRPYQQARQDVPSTRRPSQPRNVDPRKDAQDMDISPPPGGGGRATPETSRAMLLPPTPAVTLAQLPKMMSQLAGTRGLPKLDDMSPQEAFRTIQQAIQLTKQAQSTGQVEAPPSYPQHPGRTLPPLQQLEKDGDRRSPGSDYSAHSARRDSPTSSVSSLHSLSGTGSLVSAVLKPTAPSLTPSLANYYNEALISHVTGWQADHAERQANRYSEEAHSLGSLNCTRVSAELKMARSLVRLSEIQATVQEQRSLFLRQLIKELEELKSQVNFMSDS